MNLLAVVPVDWFTAVIAFILLHSVIILAEHKVPTQIEARYNTPQIAFCWRHVMSIAPWIDLSIVLVISTAIFSLLFFRSTEGARRPPQKLLRSFAVAELGLN